MKDGSAPDGHSNSFYRVLTLTVDLHESSPKRWNAFDDYSDRLYRVLTLIARPTWWLF